MKNKNGDLQVSVCLERKDHFINRLGRFYDAVARARALAFSTNIWSDFQQGDLAQTLNGYCSLVGEKDVDLLGGLNQLMERASRDL